MDEKKAKPFLKWAGGKSQLIGEIAKRIPPNTVAAKFTYIEPFVGSGAVLFWMLNNFPTLKKAVINDVNEDLINAYRAIAEKPYQLIEILQQFQTEFYLLEGNEDEKKIYYYDKRASYNTRNTDTVHRAALFVFLNRTCFNGLYRVNKNNEFNVPMGSYVKPVICDPENIVAVSKLLQKVEILCADYQDTLAYASKNSLFYLDPPYRPLSRTSSFNSYAKSDFNDAEQLRLHQFCVRLDEKKHAWILSNSDPRSSNEGDDFFDDLYQGFTIQRVDAKRSINSNPGKRGRLTELLITNEKNDEH